MTVDSEVECPILEGDACPRQAVPRADYQMSDKSDNSVIR